MNTYVSKIDQDFLTKVTALLGIEKLLRERAHNIKEAKNKRSR